MTRDKLTLTRWSKVSFFQSVGTGYTARQHRSGPGGCAFGSRLGHNLLPEWHWCEISYFQGIQLVVPKKQMGKIKSLPFFRFVPGSRNRNRTSNPPQIVNIEGDILLSDDESSSQTSQSAPGTELRGIKKRCKIFSSFFSSALLCQKELRSDNL